MNIDMKSTLFPVKEVPAITYPTAHDELHQVEYKDTGHKFIVREDTDEVISCVTNKYKLISNQEVMDIALPILKDKGGTLSEARVFNEARTMWKFRFKDIKVEIQKGDFVNPEVIIRNSYDGSTEVQAMGGAYRLVCLNGMVIGYTVDKKSVRHTIWSENHNIDGIVTNIIQSVKDIFDNEFPLMIDTAVMKDHVVKIMKLFPGQAISAFTQHLIKEPPKNYWDLFNAATWTSTHAMKRNNEATHKIEAQIFPMIKKMVKSASIAKA